MLFSYQQSQHANLPERAKRFAKTGEILATPTGIVLGTAALTTFLQETDLDKEVESLHRAVTDAESQTRVDKEVKRRIVTGKIPDNVGQTLKEIIEILGMHKTNLEIHEVPLIAVLYTNVPLSQDAVIINITGWKGLADAVRTLWSRIYVSPYPHQEVKAAVAIYRMPPVEKTVHIKRLDHFHVDASEGWGLLVQSGDQSDRYEVTTENITIQDKTIVNQTRAVIRNPRTGEIIHTTIQNGNGQKVPDDVIRMMIHNMKKVGESEAIFGYGGQKHWLLMFPQSSSVFEENAQPLEPLPVADEDLIVDGESSEEQNTTEMQPISTTQEDGEAEQSTKEYVDNEQGEEYDQRTNARSAQSLDQNTRNQEDQVKAQHQIYQEVEPQHEEETYEIEETPQITLNEQTAQGHHQKTKEFATGILMHALSTIEFTMREWLHDVDQPERFDDLVQRISQKRVVPYKQRVLTLYEMKQQASFEDPTPDQVSFAFETMDRFLKEF